MIVAFQTVIHKQLSHFNHRLDGDLFWAMFTGSLQEMPNTEIILGFPECVQGDKPRVKLLFAGTGYVQVLFAGMLGRGEIRYCAPARGV